jgi:dCMP deaminase
VILGLTGKNGSGKGEIATFLAERSFHAHSLSDEIRRDLERTGTPITRETMIERGRELRRVEGPQVLAERILAHLDPSLHHVVDSIRHPAEVHALQHHPEFILIAVDASPRVRFERLRARGRAGDPETFEAFLELEAREVGNEEAAAQQLDRAIALADRTLTNEGTVEELRAQVLALVQETLRTMKRPPWDEYFMNIARVVASRSNCLKRKVAAVIVKDRRIISTGYNGTPRGVKNCNEGGCPRCAGLAPQGSSLAECVCSHGEENAIVQAAYHGVSLKGATLYSTYSPCLLCAKMIVNSGIAEVVYRDEYPLGETAGALLQEAGVVIRRLETTPE